MARIVAFRANLKDWTKKSKSKNKEKITKSTLEARKRKSIRKELDKIFSILTRSKGKCERCGKTTTLQTVHIFSRKNLATRWDKDNVLCGCAGCHFWAHQNPILFTEFVKSKKGVEKYEEIKKKSITIKKWAILELEELLEEFTMEVKNEH